MAGIFGNIGQIGFVVRDIKESMLTWSKKNGVGPWFYSENVQIGDFAYRGTPKNPGPIVHGAFSYSGDMQFELIELRSDSQCLYKEFLDAGFQGMQHWGRMVDDYDARVEEALSLGFVIGHKGVVPGQGRFTYFDHGGPPSTISELIDYTDERKEFFGYIKKTAANWDGVKDPIRLVDPEKGIV